MDSQHEPQGFGQLAGGSEAEIKEIVDLQYTKAGVNQSDEGNNPLPERQYTHDAASGLCPEQHQVRIEYLAINQRFPVPILRGVGRGMNIVVGASCPFNSEHRCDTSVDEKHMVTGEWLVTSTPSSMTVGEAVFIRATISMLIRPATLASFVGGESSDQITTLVDQNHRLRDQTQAVVPRRHASVK
jgi:hypothetical protein